MQQTYLGKLDYRDPLYGYMVDEVLPGLGCGLSGPVFHVSRMQGTNMVYRYHEENSGLGMIGKFYTGFRPDKALRLKGEFDNLVRARALGLATLPNYVARPLGRDARMGLGLLEEYVEGKDLDHYIRRAAFKGRAERLKERLGDLAFFLAELHKSAGLTQALSLTPSECYFDRLVGDLSKRGIVDDDAQRRLMRLKKRWLERDYMHMDQEVLIHGDATVTNFIFPKGEGVVAIDLERMKTGDRVYDVGMVAGELKHALMWRVGERYASEEYIGHFLREYARHFGDPDRVYWSVVRRNPFYMAMTELRIARNDWLDSGHRKWLVGEAMRCLKWGLKLG